MDNIIIHVKQSDKYNLVSLTGVLKFDNCEEFIDDLTLMAGYEKHLFLDMQRLEYIDSSGVGAIFNIVKRLRKNKLRLYVFNLNHKIQQIFKLVKLADFVKIIEKETMEKTVPH